MFPLSSRALWRVPVQGSDAGGSRAHVELTVARIPITCYHADVMRARMSKFLQKLCFRNDLLGSCNHFQMCFADPVAGGLVGMFARAWEVVTRGAAKSIAPHSLHHKAYTT